MKHKFKPHFITLGVSDLARSRKFYEEVLDLHPDKITGDFVFYDLHGIILGLYPDKLLAEDATVEYKKPGSYRGLTLSHNVVEKEDVDGLVNRLKSGGTEIVKEAEDTFWGGRSAYFRDPDGHLWEIAWNPFAPFDEKGFLQINK